MGGLYSERLWKSGFSHPHRHRAPLITIFTALHGMQTRSSDENSVRPSVRLSVRPSHACIVTKRKKDLSRFIYHTKEHLS